MMTVELHHDLSPAVASDELQLTTDSYAVSRRLIDFGAPAVTVEVKKFVIAEARGSACTCHEATAETKMAWGSAKANRGVPGSRSSRAAGHLKKNGSRQKRGSYSVGTRATPLSGASQKWAFQVTNKGQTGHILATNRKPKFTCS